jgi:predicted phage gp36 major capsid-like protein
MYPLNDLFMSKVEQVESELRKLSQAELRQIRDRLDDVIEDELQSTPEFESSIRQSERDMASGKSESMKSDCAWRVIRTTN